ncbi:low affinity immunoglobulin gamma Fc region receptor II-like [Anabas testudineus]|nr:low affinity immunoglobulin gamma Fc region receptor II-like [Anabas testudineus]
MSASLTVYPNRSQFFKYESLYLSCDDNRKSSEWTVKAKTVRGVSGCGRDWGSLQSSSCIINEVYSWNSGVYWCESTSGETSPEANITVTENNVILESPVSPVTEGESVTLRCTAKSNSSSPRASVFMKDRSPVGAAIMGQMTIPAVSKSNEGLYMCMITGLGASVESWLTVRGRDFGGFTEVVTRVFSGHDEEEVEEEEEEEAVSADPHSGLIHLRVIFFLVVVTPYLLSTIFLGLVYRDEAKGSAARQCQSTRHCKDEVQMEKIK